MENNGFKRADSLEEPTKINESFLKPAGDLNDNGMSYFQRAGSLEEPTKINESFLKPAGDLNDNGMSYFQRAGSLEEPTKINESFLKPAGDLDTPKPENSFTFEEKKEELKTPEEIRQWLKTIISGEKKANYAFGEGLQVVGAGQKFVSIEELQNMVKNGDNIIKAEYFENMNMVMIEFERFKVPSKSR